MALERRLGFRPTSFYSWPLKGFAATVTPAQRRAPEASVLSRFPTLTPSVVELILRLTAEVPGTPSKDDAAIRRLSVRLY